MVVEAARQVDRVVDQVAPPGSRGERPPGGGPGGRGEGRPIGGPREGASFDEEPTTPPGQILGARVRESLGLSETQIEALDALQSEVDKQISRILNADQKIRFEQMEARRR